MLQLLSSSRAGRLAASAELGGPRSLKALKAPLGWLRLEGNINHEFAARLKSMSLGHRARNGNLQSSAPLETNNEFEFESAKWSGRTRWEPLRLLGAIKLGPRDLFELPNCRRHPSRDRPSFRPAQIKRPATRALERAAAIGVELSAGAEVARRAAPGEENNATGRRTSGRSSRIWPISSSPDEQVAGLCFGPP